MIYTECLKNKSKEELFALGKKIVEESLKKMLIRSYFLEIMVIHMVVRRYPIKML